MKKSIFLKIATLICLIASLLSFTACDSEENKDINCLVTFIVDGEVYDSVTFQNESAFNNVETPVKQNCDFDGWYLDENYNNPFNESTVIEIIKDLSSLTVYAKFNDGHVHNYSTNVVSPNCTEQGYTEYVCKCGYVYTDNFVDALGHEYTVNVISPTCTEGGYTEYQCDCGDYYTDTTTDKLNHDFVNYFSNDDATYDADGTKTAKCEREGCNESDTVIDEGSMLIASLTFKTLTLQDYSANGKVTNSTIEFNFDNEITVSKKATYHVFSANDLNTELNKTVELVVGDNNFVLTVNYNGVTYASYSVVIRKLPIYTVKFQTGNDTVIEDKFIEEGSLVAKPNDLTKAGYTFNGWYYDFDTPVTDNITITANWSANTNTPYVVKYYFENVENDEFTLNAEENQNLVGETDTVATFNLKEFTHFTYSYSSSENIIKGDGSLVIENYFIRNKYEVKFNGNGGELVSGDVIQNVKYESNANAPIFSRVGYNFNGFDKEFTNVSSPITVNALWTAKSYTLKFDLYGFDGKVEDISATYDSDVVLPTLTRDGYGFIGWYLSSDKVSSGKWNIDGDSEITLTAKWESIFNLVENKITGLTTYGNSLLEFKVPSRIDNVNVTAISNNAFALNTIVKIITIEDGIVEIGNSAFSQCLALEKVILPKNLTAINENTFYLCEKLLDVNIPNNVLTINDYAFYGCNSLREITIPSLTNNIGYGAFGECGNITKFIVNDNANFTTVNDSLYSKNEEVLIKYASGKTDTAFTVGKNVKEISAFAFSSAKNLTAIAIGNSCLKIGESAFSNCVLITNISLSEGLEYIGSNAFRNCEKLSEITIPNSVKQISREAFYGCKELEKLTLGSGVTSLGHDLFVGCVSLVNIDVNVNNNSFKSVEGNLYNYNGTHLIQYAIGKTESTFVVPNGVIVIRSTAFANANNLTEVILPNTLESINSTAFINCKNLSTITIPNSVVNIGDSAFYGCVNLKTVINKSKYLTIEKGSESNGYIGYYAQTIE